MSKKTFLLMMPDYSDFPNLFMDNLKKTDFLPFVITDHPSKFKYKGSEKIINFYRKTFLKDRDYKKMLIEEHKLREYYNKISQLEMLDYVLVIRPDSFPIPVIQELKKKTKKLIAYQWDGIEKFPEVKKYFDLFDSFFCFDSKDKYNNLKQITNFYFDCISPVYKEFNTKKPKLYFVGVYWENREEKIDRFIKEVSKIDVELSITIQYYHKSEIKNPKIKYVKDRITFLENLKNVEDSDILLDFVDPVHDGLSIRFFEGLYYKKKVITDNKTVKSYDFYHPNNIFVLEDNNYGLIENFLNLPYYEVNDEIVKKYSFTNWIKQITQA